MSLLGKFGREVAPILLRMFAMNVHKTNITENGVEHTINFKLLKVMLNTPPEDDIVNPVRWLLDIYWNDDYKTINDSHHQVQKSLYINYTCPSCSLFTIKANSFSGIRIPINRTGFYAVSLDFSKCWMARISHI